MVATVSVITGSARTVSNYFLSLEQDSSVEYYVDQSAGIWFGDAAAMLGLTGTAVERSAFEHVLAGESPSGVPLTKSQKRRKKNRKTDRGPENDGSPKADGGSADGGGISSSDENSKGRVAGYDITVSVPKSVSIGWAISDAKGRKNIEDALRAAAKATMKDFERNVPLARRGKGGHDQVASRLLASLFLHTTNRENEPNLHVHCVIANVCHGSDGRWTAVNSRLLHNWTPALGRIFRCHLARELTKRVQVELYRPTDKQGQDSAWFEIKGVPRKLIDRFSSRRKAIESMLSKAEMRDSKARQRANLASRKKKDSKKPNIDRLSREWRAEAAKYGVTSGSITNEQRSQIKPVSHAEFRQAFSEVVRACLQNRY